MTVFDFEGKGYVSAADLIQDRISFKIPLTPLEFAKFIKNCTIFNSKPTLTQNEFMQYFIQKSDIVSKD